MDLAALEKAIKTSPPGRQTGIQNLVLLEMLRELKRRRS